MKRFTRFFSLLLCALLPVSSPVVCAFAKQAENPFAQGTLFCERFRIPALLTLHDGSVLAAADLRWNHGKDAPQNLDIATAVSPDGLGGWSHSVPNRLEDYADGTGSSQSAAYIDSALLQSESGRVFLLSDLFLSGTGYPNAQVGSGCLTIDEKKHIALAPKGSEDYSYYIADFEGGFAPVMTREGASAYSVDKEYRLYKNGALCTLAQKGDNDTPTGQTVAQSVFFGASDLHVFPTPFLCLRHSDDGGKTWSAPLLLNAAVKHEQEAFLGVCPGRGISIQYGGKERLIFPLYSNENKTEHALTIYSDDGGKTWQRASDVRHSWLLRKTSESQIITLPDGTLRMFSRNKSHYIGACDSTDGGASWTKAKGVAKLFGTKNCMVSFINTSKTLDGKPVVLCSMGSSFWKRANGVIRIGVAQADGKINWIEKCALNRGFFGYSCLTELSDGRFAVLFEDGAAHFCYRVFSLNENGTITFADKS